MRHRPRLRAVALLFVTSTVACGLSVVSATGDDPDGGGLSEQDATLDSSNATDGEGGNTGDDGGDLHDAGDGGDLHDAGDGGDLHDAGDGGDLHDAGDGGDLHDAGDGGDLHDAGDAGGGLCEAGPTRASETCNGIDDDCNGIVDDPCPTGVTLGGTVASSPMWGSDTGPNAYDDTCPAGEVLIGVSVRMEQYMRTIRGRCGAIAIVEDTSKTPYEYTLTVSPGTVMDEHGTVQGTVSSAQCPPDTVVVAVSGRAGAWVDQVVLHCAPLSLTTGPGPSFELTVGSVVATPGAGGSGGSPVPRYDCPAGSFVNRLRGSTGSYVDNVTFSCARPTITRKN